MIADRAEWTGVGAALAFHLALVAVLSMSLAHVAEQPEPPSMEVELVPDVALKAAAPTAASPAPPPSAQPEPEQQLPLQPPPPEAIAPPTPTPVQRPVQRPQPPRPTSTPQRPTATPARPAPTPARPAQRPGIGKDFLKSFDDDLAPRAGAATTSAPRFDAKAQASVASLISRQIEPCARRQRHVAESAKSMSVVLGLSFLPSGQLRGRPNVVRVDGLNSDNEQFRDLAVDQAIASYQQCSPLRLPAELYSTPQGGWKNIRIIFDVR